MTKSTFAKLVRDLKIADDIYIVANYPLLLEKQDAEKDPDKAPVINESLEYYERRLLSKLKGLFAGKDELEVRSIIGSLLS